MENTEDKIKCPWCLKYPLYQKYHDEEWGVPIRSSQKLFEKIILDGTQAGLSWWTILNRRDNYRIAYDNFDPQIMSRYDNSKIEELLNNKSIIRNKVKIKAAINNAQCYVDLLEKDIAFDQFIWETVNGDPIINHYKTLVEVPTNSTLSNSLSNRLKEHGFKFVGTTIIYAFMQAAGLYNDHLVDCHRHSELS